MSLDQAILHGHEHRKPYYRSGRFDRTCRPHGGCSWCYGNRMYAEQRRQSEADDRLNDFLRAYQDASV